MTDFCARCWSVATPLPHHIGVCLSTHDSASENLHTRPVSCINDHQLQCECTLEMCGPVSHSSQDVAVTAKMIHDLWSHRKLDPRVAKEMLLDSRCQGAQRLYQQIDWHLTEEINRHTNRLINVLRPVMESMLNEFYGAPEIDRWLAQFEHEFMKNCFRFKCLLFRGDSESGKSKKAVSLFGSENTMQVNAQGMAPALPSIRVFDRTQHLAILWDEIEPSQVLHNKLVFQSGLEPVALQQSACNGFSYTKWLFQTPMLLCSNKFNFAGTKDCPLATEDTQWLEKNVIVVDPPPGGKWYKVKSQGDATGPSTD